MSLSLLLSAALTACGGGGDSADKTPAAAVASIAELPTITASASEAEASAPSAAELSYLSELPEASLVALNAVEAAAAAAEPGSILSAAAMDIAAEAPMAKIQSIPQTVASVTQNIGSSGSIVKTVLLPPTGLVPSSIWNQVESLATAPVTSGDGITTTASSVAQLAAPARGMFYGFRDAREDWPGLIDKYERTTTITAWVNTEKARVDAWIGRRFERADLVGGWTQNYNNPKTGLAAVWSPTSPEPPNGTSDAETKFKAAWVAIGRDYNITQMQAAARLFRLTGESSYAVWAAQQLDFYAANYASWPLRTNEGRSTMYMQGLDEAVALFPLIDTARLLESYAGSARNLAWRDKLFMPMATNLKSTSAPMSNIALWHNAAIAAIAMRFRDTALLDYAQNGAQGIKAVIAYALTADNFWIEGTFAYNNYVLDVMSRMLVQASLEGYGARFTAEREQALKLLLASFDYRFDNNTLPNPNDSRSTQPVIAQPAHWLLFRVAPTYWGLDKASKWRTWESLLDVPVTVPLTAPTIPSAMTRNFPTMRHAVLRAGTWQAFVHYGQANGNHFQQELTAFELHEGTTPIAADPGTVNYSSPYHASYFQMGPANNVPLINGAGQSAWAKGNVLTFNAAESRLLVEQPRYQNDVNVKRGYRVTTAGFVEQSNITVTSGISKRLGVVFNTTCDVLLGVGTSVAPTVAALPTVSAMGYWSKVSMFNGQSTWKAQLSCGAKRYEMTVTGPSGQRIYVAKAPNTPMPSERNTLYYEVTGTSAQFETVIRVAAQ